MFVDPRAAALKSVEVRGVRGNSVWGRRMLQFKGRKHRIPKPPKPNLCEQCKAMLGDPDGPNAEMIRARIQRYLDSQDRVA